MCLTIPLKKEKEFSRRINEEKTKNGYVEEAFLNERNSF